MLEKILRPLQNFWFVGDASTTLAVLRRVWAFFILKDVIFIWASGFSVMFAKGAPYRETAFAGRAAAGWNILSLFSDSTLFAVLIALVALLVWVIVSEKFHLALGLVVYLLACFENLSPGLFLSHHGFMRYMGLCLLFSGPVSLRLIQLLMSELYLNAFLAKIAAPAWLHGDAVGLVLKTDWVSTELSRALFANAEFSSLVFKTMTWGTLALEGFICWGLWFKATRKWALIAAVAFHLGMYLLLDIYSIQEMMFFGLCAFVDFETVKIKVRTAFARSRDLVSDSHSSEAAALHE